MAEESFDEKTEKATPKKREDVRSKGQVAKSRELPSVAVLICSFITLSILGSYIYSEIQSDMRQAFSFLGAAHIESSELIVFTKKMVVSVIFILCPVLVAIVATAILANICQIGVIFSAESLKPKVSKLNPINGFKRLFSSQSVMELVKTLLKLSIIGVVAGFSVKEEMKDLPVLGETEISGIVTYILLTILKIFAKCALAMVIIVVIDYTFQKRNFEKKIRMTKKEVKDELKTMEGDPHVKARIKRIQIHTARKRMMHSIPQADVVITNPTHLAVAVKYDSSVMQAPKVIAKGARKLAKKIIDMAKQHGIPVVENKELAQSLYLLVEVGEEIPAGLYHAVAEVLAYIYRLKGKHSGIVG